MPNHIERFIRDNRDAFDTETPSKRVWESIESELGKPAQKHRIIQMPIFRWSAAAAVLLLITTTLWILTRPTLQSDRPLTQVQDPIVADIDPQYALMVAQFNTMIEAKQKEIQSIEKDNPDLYRKFSVDIRKLDSTYQVLRNTLPANPNKEQLLEAMISNLQMQISLLNQQLQIIQQVNKPKSSNT